MNVLLATDFSPGAARARELARSLRYPDGTVFEVLHVVDPKGIDLVAAFAGVPWDRTRELEREVARFSEPLRNGLRWIRPRVRVGDPARQIARHAHTSGADLVIIGSRDRGTLAATLLGSVTAAVLDRVHAPVLVARTSAIDRVILAEDGSPDAAGAAQQLATSPLFADAAITVVSVVPTQLPWPGTAGAFPHVDDYDAYLIGRSHVRTRAEAAIAERLSILRKAGRRATGELREGDVAAEILESARSHGANLIVAGSRGLSGLSRLFLGSVARQLLGDAQTSLLIARATPPPGDSPRTADDPDEVSYEHRQPTPSRAA
jgi:nucleotide-binding universal stress UspA family protein